MAPEVEVRRVRADEWRAFRELRMAALKADRLAFGSTLERELAYPQARWEEWVPRGATSTREATFVAATTSRQLVGMAGAFAEETHFSVWGMWVNPAWRGRGLGEELLRATLGWVESRRPGSEVHLEVNPQQESAVRIYRKNGFRYVGPEQPLGHHPPAVVMPMARSPGPRRARGPRSSERHRAAVDPVVKSSTPGPNEASERDRTVEKNPPTKSNSPARRTRARPVGPSDWRDVVIARLRQLIEEADPDAVEEQKWRKPSNPAGVPVWYHDGILCHVVALKNRVRITFLKGASLEDANGLFNACFGGNSQRAIDIGKGEVVDAEGIRALVRAAAALNVSEAPG
jgi:ribosomal protein S18 acetylase RimI-like enzyme